MSPDKDIYYMNLAFSEAKKGVGFTSPNPLVGAVIVKNNKIIATGYHHKLGLDHAEIDAIKKSKKDALKDSSLYVNLEPCSHYGRTPPCVDKIISSGIKEVIISNKDIDKRVNGIEILKKAKIKVRSGILENEGKKLNALYFHFKKTNKPYIVLKAALTLDGKIATFNNDSKWISNEKSRELVHKLRLKLKSIAVGKNTVIKDKPKLNCRFKGYENKPVDKLVFSNSKIETKCFAKNSGKIFFINDAISKSGDKFLDFCFENEVDSALVEGGGKVYTWFLNNGIVDRIFLFYKPSFLGKDGINIFDKTGITSIKKLKEFRLVNLQKIENNFLIELSKGEPLCLLD